MQKREREREREFNLLSMENQQTIVRYLGSLLDLVCVYIYYKVLLCDVCACRIPYALSHDYYSNFFFFSSPDVAAAPAALPTHERTDMTADEMFRHHILFRYRYHLDSFFTCKKTPFNIFNGRQPSTPESVNSFFLLLLLFLVRMYVPSITKIASMVLDMYIHKAMLHRLCSPFF